MAEHRFVLERPSGSPHPRCPGSAYPLDYGYLDGTSAGDGGGIDVWRGEGGSTTVAALACCIDLLKGDAALKLLAGCNVAEIGVIERFHNSRRAGMHRPPPSGASEPEHRK